MGCASSKVDNEEKVARCKARKRFMKHAVASRHQFAASHAAYMQALKNVGAAFRQFGETELPDSSSSSIDHDYNMSSPSTPDAKPPPRPLFLPPPSPPGHNKIDPAIAIPEEEEVDGSELSSPVKSTGESKKTGAARGAIPSIAPAGSVPPPPPPPKSSAWGFLDPFQEDEATAAVAVASQAFEASSKSAGARAKLWFPAAEKDLEQQRSSDNSLAIIVRQSGSKELVDVLRELDELFLRGYQSCKEVGNLLEARKIHYHSNFVENRGFDSHSSKVLNAISWSNWKSPLKRKTDEAVALAVTGEDYGAHSGTLDRLLVWEKKLFEEMRTAEANRLEYEKKCAQLRHQDSKGDYNESIDKTRNMIKMIQTRIAVALEGVDTAVTAIIKIRDEDLYPQLLELEEGLMGMWSELFAIHEKQYSAVSRMKPLDCLLGTVEATSNIHRLATSQLEASLDNWYSCLNKLITSQRDYMRNLSGWVRLCVMPFEDIKDSPTPSGAAIPPVHDLCLEWHQALDRLPDKVALEAIKSFVVVIHKIVELQNTELQHRKKVESLTKDIDKKLGYIHSYEKKHPESASSGTASDHHHHSSNNSHPDDGDELAVLHDILPPKSPLADRRAAVEFLRRKLEDEKDQVSKAVSDTRAMTLNSLHTGLPSVFQSVSGFANLCFQAFQLVHHSARINKQEAGYSP